MDPKQINKQMMNFNKSVFDQTFQMMKILHDHTEDTVLRFLEKSNWITADSKKVIIEWTKVCKTGSEYFKNCADENYKKITDYFVQLEKEETKKTDKDR